MFAKNVFKVPNPGYAATVEESFAAQRVMTLFGAALSRVEPGLVEIGLPYRTDLTQQDGFLHAGVVTTVVDSACGYAALTLMPREANVLTVEFKVNFLAPAVGERFSAAGRVLRSGRTLKVCQGDVYAFTGSQRKHVALMTATMTTLLPAEK